MEEDTVHSQYDGNNEDVMFENNSMDITDKYHVRTSNANANEYITEGTNQYQDQFNNGNQNYNNNNKNNKNNYQQNINDNFVNNDYSQSLQ